MKPSATPIPVYLARCPDYRSAGFAEAIGAALESLMDGTTLHGSTVLVKPNLISATAPPHGVTDPAFIAAVCNFLLDCGARVKLGDSPAFGSAASVAKRLGIELALKKMTVDYVEFTTAVKKRLASGLAITLAAEALECDLLLGLPKIKAHKQMYMSLAVKNLYGTIKGMNKALLHMTQGKKPDVFAEMILDLADILPAQAHLADGIIAMHKSGPMDGEPLPLGLLAGSISPVALDCALLAALQFSPANCPVSRVALSQQRAGSRLADLVFIKERPETWQGCGFLPPQAMIPVRFSLTHFFTGLVSRVKTDRL